MIHHLTKLSLTVKTENNQPQKLYLWPAKQTLIKRLKYRANLFSHQPF